VASLHQHAESTGLQGQPLAFSQSLTKPVRQKAGFDAFPAEWQKTARSVFTMHCAVYATLEFNGPHVLCRTKSLSVSDLNAIHLGLGTVWHMIMH
jgi:hypothetical protein